MLSPLPNPTVNSLTNKFFDISQERIASLSQHFSFRSKCKHTHTYSNIYVYAYPNSKPPLPTLKIHTNPSVNSLINGRSWCIRFSTIYRFTLSAFSPRNSNLFNLDIHITYCVFIKISIYIHTITCMDIMSLQITNFVSAFSSRKSKVLKSI